MAVYRNQIGEITYTATDRFRENVVKGLSASPKFLQSKYFYDAEGDKLFRQIMDCPEYYLTRCEMEIFSTQHEVIAQTLLKRDKEFDVVELGAGDAVKSTHLLRYLSQKGIDYTYYPVDISENVIHLLEKELPKRIPGIHIEGLNGEYLDMVEKANLISDCRKVYLFLGSNIGNFTTQYANEFLLKLRKQMTTGDMLIVGFDLKKNPKQILEAYNDAGGITKAFNLNLLKRINRELDSAFDLTQFDHYATYNPITGACRSYIISLQKQQVIIDEEVLEFEKNEDIYMELSQKYSVPEIDDLANQTGFKPVNYFYDSHDWFVDVVWEKL
jgi:L-histidine N-alpha-methyltransferase